MDVLIDLVTYRRLFYLGQRDRERNLQSGKKPLRCDVVSYRITSSVEKVMKHQNMRQLRVPVIPEKEFAEGLHSQHTQ